MAKKRFTAVPTAEGKSGAMAAVDIPDDVLAALGGKRVKVKATVNGFTFRTTTAVMGGRQMLGFNTANRKAARLEPGTKVTVTIENDDEPRVIDPPAELAKAFKSNKAARDTWNGLSYSHQREYAEWIESAKKAETRERRVTTAIERLNAGAKTCR